MQPFQLSDIFIVAVNDVGFFKMYETNILQSLNITFSLKF
jgi:hypothetical protein